MEASGQAADIEQHFVCHNVRNFYSVSISGYHIAIATKGQAAVALDEDVGGDAQPGNRLKSGWAFGSSVFVNRWSI